LCGVRGLTVLHGIYPDPINTIRLDGLIDPGVHSIDDIIVLGVEVHKSYIGVAERALFNIRLLRSLQPVCPMEVYKDSTYLVVVVCDEAKWMELGWLIERCISTEGGWE
jgi:hypothetical protein